MGDLFRRAAVRVAVAAGASVLAAGMTAGAGTAGAEAAAARALAAGRGGGSVSGTWGTAQEVPGTGGLNAGGFAAVTSVSCATAGNCSAGGTYADGAGHGQAFVVTQTNGTWGKAKQVPGTATLNASGYAAVQFRSSDTFQVTDSERRSGSHCEDGGHALSASVEQPGN